LEDVGREDKMGAEGKEEGGVGVISGFKGFPVIDNS
jgi:hypothetical protein